MGLGGIGGMGGGVGWMSWARLSGRGLGYAGWMGGGIGLGFGVSWRVGLSLVGRILQHLL